MNRITVLFLALLIGSCILTVNARHQARTLITEKAVLADRVTTLKETIRRLELTNARYAAKDLSSEEAAAAVTNCQAMAAASAAPANAKPDGAPASADQAAAPAEEDTAGDDDGATAPAQAAKPPVAKAAAAKAPPAATPHKTDIKKVEISHTAAKSAKAQ